MAMRVGFLGAGNMASALSQGFVKAGLAKGEDTHFYDILPEKSRELADKVGGHVAKSIRPLMQSCDVIVLAVKPQNARELMPEVAPWAGPKHLFISILAGVPTTQLESQIGGEPRVVRVMPNTPSLVGLGASGVAKGTYASDADLETVLAFFRSVGVAEAVLENLIDAVTAISGSGPAYFMYLIEALIDAGVEMGLSPDAAKTLVLQTAAGASRLAMDSNEPPASLRAKVMSKGGTTEAGMNVLINGGFAQLIKQCAKAAAARGAELAKLA